MEYTRGEWEESFPGEDYPLDSDNEDTFWFFLIEPPQEMEEE